MPLQIPQLPSVPLQSFAVPLSVADQSLHTGIPTANALPPLALPSHQYSNAFNPGIHPISQLSASHLFAGPTCQLGNLTSLHLSQEQAIHQLGAEHQAGLVSQDEFPENMSALLYSNGHNELPVPLSGTTSEIIKTGTDLSTNSQLLVSDSFIKIEATPQFHPIETSKTQSKSASAKRGAVKTEIISVTHSYSTNTQQLSDPNQAEQSSNTQSSAKPKLSKRRRDGKPVLSLWNTKAGQVKPARGLLEVLDEVASSAAASVPSPPPQDSFQPALSTQVPLLTATDSPDGIAKKPRRKRGEQKRRANGSESPATGSTTQAQPEHTPALNSGPIFLTSCEPFSIPSSVLNTHSAGIASFGLEAGTDAPDFALLGAGVPPPHEMLEHHYLDATGALAQSDVRLAYARCAEEMALTATHANSGMEEYAFSAPFSDMNPQIIIIQPNSAMLPLDFMPPPLAYAAPPQEQSPQPNLMPMQTAPATLSVQSNSLSTIQMSTTPKKKTTRKAKAEATGAASIVGASSSSDANSELKPGISTQASAGSNGNPISVTGSSRRSGESRVFWTPQENTALHDGIRMYGVGKWRSILEWARVERGVMQHRSLGSLAKRWYHHEQRRHGPATGPNGGVDGALYSTADSAQGLYLAQSNELGGTPQLHNADGTPLVKPTRDRRGRPPKLDRDRVTPRKTPKPKPKSVAAAFSAPSLAAQTPMPTPATALPAPSTGHQVSEPQPQQQACALAQPLACKLEQVVATEASVPALAPSAVLLERPPAMLPEHSSLQLHDLLQTGASISIETPLHQLIPGSEQPGLMALIPT